MATQTANLNLNKPEGTDIVDIDVLNENMDILDTTVKGVQDFMESAGEDLTEIQGAIQTAQQDIEDIEEQIPDIQEYAETAEASAKAAKDSAEKSENYYYLSRMQAATGGFLHLVNENGRIYCVRTANCDLEMKMEDGRLYYGYE